jgi:predicted nucleic acid-binding protein
MILADSSVWIDHLRAGNDLLVERLEQGKVLMHPFVLGELMLGSLRDRRQVIQDLHALPAAPVATFDETELLIETGSLHARGIGYVDVALLASVRLHGGARLWTNDRRLAVIAGEMSIGLS